MSIGATEPFEFTPPPEEEELEEYYDPFILNEDGTVDLDLNGKATIRGERLRVENRLRVLGNSELDGDVVIGGTLIVNGIDVGAFLSSLSS
jgi:hypothetical protein